MWAPLRSATFRALWIASLVSNLGTWMHGVGAAWLMTELSKDARLNALVSASESLPMFLLSLPAGALADIFDRRKMLLLVSHLLASSARDWDEEAEDEGEAEEVESLPVARWEWN